ncbi:helix-turn-helix domain-containing protein [Pseudonocardia sp. CA-142604]|uniref:AraC-like ligand-binding domain-containing protein n=1 Tax=Pseudonocardia sp. CA-142604 TaxID=3240024 RepID=UPI003D8CE3A9
MTRFPVLRTKSLDEARDAVSRVYLDHELTAQNDALHMTLNAVSLRLFTLGYLRYESSAKAVVPPPGDCYQVNLTVAGRTNADRTDGDRATTLAHSSGIVLSPEQQNTVRWSPDAQHLILKIPRLSLENHLGDLLGRRVREVIDFDFGIDLTTGRGRSLLASVEFLARELDRPGGLTDMPVAREQLEAFVMTQLLHTGRHQFADELAAPAEPVRRGRLAPVLDYMEKHADEPLTPQELARVGCMSVRTLHATFQQALGESPMSYLRRIRLDHVRAELQRSDPTFVRVTDVAIRWGFLHQSRFAQQYRAQFGELPRETLRASAGGWPQPGPTRTRRQRRIGSTATESSAGRTYPFHGCSPPF